MRERSCCKPEERFQCELSRRCPPAMSPACQPIIRFCSGPRIAPSQVAYMLHKPAPRLGDLGFRLLPVRATNPRLPLPTHPYPPPPQAPPLALTRLESLVVTFTNRDRRSSARRCSG